MTTRRHLILALALVCCAHVGAADDAALRACSALADTTARLACYDALPLAAAPAALPAVAAEAAPSTATATTSGVPLPTPASTQAFGRERKDDLSEIVSHIPGLFTGWEPRTRFTLANGQVWQVVDESRGVYALRDPKVTVRRATMSGFELDIEGAKRMPRVRRVD